MKLDADCSFKTIGDSDIDIFWGAYIGTEDEILVAGNLRELMHDIERMRAEAKARKGMDHGHISSQKTRRLMYRRGSTVCRLSSLNLETWAQWKDALGFV